MKFIYGKEPYFIERELKQQLRSLDHEPIVYNSETPLDIVIEEISTYSLLTEEKTIVVIDHPIMNAPNPSLLVDALLEDQAGTNLIFVAKYASIKKTNKFYKFMKRTADCKEFNQIDPKQLFITIQEIVTSKGGSINKANAMYIAANLPNDLRIIISEIEKLLNENPHITEKQVKISLSKYNKDGVFVLANALIEFNAADIIRTYKSKIESGEQPVMIINQISNVLSLVLSINAFKSLGKTNKDIAEELSIHPYRIQKVSELLHNTSIERIKKSIQDLAKLDLGIKTGNIDSKQGLDNFILNFIK